MAEIKFTDTLKCTATHNKLASASQIYDDVNTKDVFPDSQDLKQSSINKYLAQAINSASQNGGIYYNSKKTIAELTALTSVSKGDIFMITEDFNWDESSSFADKQNEVYPANTCVLIMQSATAAGKKSFVPLGTDFNLYYKGYVSFDDLFNRNRYPGEVYIISDDFTIEGTSYSDNTPIMFHTFYLKGESVDTSNISTLAFPLSAPKQEIDTSALENRIAALEAKLSMA